MINDEAEARPPACDGPPDDVEGERVGTPRPYASQSYPRRGSTDGEHEWSRQRPYEKITRVSAGPLPSADDYLVRTMWIIHDGDGVDSLEAAWSCIWREDGVNRGRYDPDYDVVYPAPVSAGGLEEAHNALVARVQAGELP